jgi:hypothetical protein
MCFFSLWVNVRFCVGEKQIEMKVGTGRETGTESERQRIRESERKRCSESQPILRERDGTLCLPY